MEMMRALLAERFKLQYHVEQREKPIYALVIAKGGHKLTRPEDGCVPPRSKPISTAQPPLQPIQRRHHDMPLEAIVGGLAECCKIARSSIKPGCPASGRRC